MNEYEVEFKLIGTLKVDANNPTDAEEKALEELDMEFGFSETYLDGTTTVESVKEV